MNFYRYLGARLEESANRAGVFDTERRIEGAQLPADNQLGRGAAHSGGRRHPGDGRQTASPASGISSVWPASSPNSTPAA